MALIRLRFFFFIFIFLVFVSIYINCIYLYVEFNIVHSITSVCVSIFPFIKCDSRIRFLGYAILTFLFSCTHIYSSFIFYTRFFFCSCLAVIHDQRILLSNNLSLFSKKKKLFVNMKYMYCMLLAKLDGCLFNLFLSLFTFQMKIIESLEIHIRIFVFFNLELP